MSVTVSVAMNVRGPVTCRCASGSVGVEVVPSPKSHRYVSAPPPGFVDPALEKATVNGRGPDIGVAEATADGPLGRIRRICPVVKDR